MSLHDGSGIESIEKVSIPNDCDVPIRKRSDGTVSCSWTNKVSAWNRTDKPQTDSAEKAHSPQRQNNDTAIKSKDSDLVNIA